MLSTTGRRSHETVTGHHESLLFLFTSLVNKKKLMVNALTGRLNALNPAAVLDRGYSITRFAGQDGHYG
ncbi:MAG: hypothetical protein R2860_02835 [Desulfobacterales bacterium]